MALIPIADFSPSDFELYFKGSFFKLIPPESNGEWVYYEGQENIPGSWVFRRKLGNPPRRPSPAKPETFPKDFFLLLSKTQWKKSFVDVVFPVGFFNTRTSVVWCDRTGSRQNFKGLKLGHSWSMESMERIVKNTFSGPENEAARSLLSSHCTVSLTPDFLSSTVEAPKYPSLQDALIQVRSRKTFSRALSPHFAVTPHHANKDYLLFFFDTPVAEIYSRENKVKTLVEAFRQEITSLLEPQGAKVS